MASAIRVGLVQAAPVCFDAEACIEKMADLASDAAKDGAKLVAVGETWLPGYPAWIDHSPGAMTWDNPATKAAYAAYRANSVAVPGPLHERLGRVARSLGVALVIGCSERVDEGPGRGTLYNTLLTYDADGALVNHHRKLVPTYTERVIWGPGDAAGLRSAETAAGRVSSLVCWEHWMPIPRQVLHESGELIHVAVWPWVHERHQIASRQYAFEGRCYVLALGQIQRGSDIPAGLDRAGVDDDELILRGGSCVIAPDASFVVEPVMDEERVIVCEIEPDACDEEAMTLDVTGHYHRPELLGVWVDQGDRMTTQPPPAE
ncbi:MAG: carbon-nitrogen hydrolase family protein [Planctomycetota bacterium]